MITYTRSHQPAEPWSGQQRCHGTLGLPACDIPACETSLDSGRHKLALPTWCPVALTTWSEYIVAQWLKCQVIECQVSDL